MNNPIKQKLKLNKITQSVLSLMFVGLLFILYVENPNSFKIKNGNVSCRIGITTDLERRKREWISEYKKEGKTIKNWIVLSVHKSKSSAQAVETREAKLQNCEAYPGGRGSKKAIWYVYKIEY